MSVPRRMRIASAVCMALAGAALSAGEEVSQTLDTVEVKGQALEAAEEGAFSVTQIGQEKIRDERISVITSPNPEERGCQLSIRVKNSDKNLFDEITSKGVFADWREPDVIRVAPVPLYNSFTDVYKFAEILKDCLIKR